MPRPPRLSPSPLIYLLFFLSGISGLIYQVVWVRVFGNVFGNTIYSASIVVAVFMLGLGVGSYVVGAWADRRYARLRLFEFVEAPRPRSTPTRLRIRCCAVRLRSKSSSRRWDWRLRRCCRTWSSVGADFSVCPRAVGLVRAVYVVLSGAGRHCRRAADADHAAHGRTLTLLIRHLVRTDLEVGGWRIALLYGINTAGAASVRRDRFRAGSCGGAVGHADGGGVLQRAGCRRRGATCARRLRRRRSG